MEITDHGGSSGCVSLRGMGKGRWMEKSPTQKKKKKFQRKIQNDRLGIRKKRLKKQTGN